MKKILNLLGFVAVLVSAASCKLNGESSQSLSYTFENAEAEMKGYVDPDKHEDGVIWALNFYNSGIGGAYVTVITPEGEDAYLPEGTFKCGTWLDRKIGTFIQGAMDKEGKPLYSYVITGSDGYYLYYSLLTDGTLSISKNKDEYTLTGSMFSNATVVSLSFKGEIKYSNQEEGTTE